MEGWKQRNKGREDKVIEEMATGCYFLFQNPCIGVKDGGERMREEQGDVGGGWKQMS